MVARTLAAFGVKNRDRGTRRAKTTVPASVVNEHTNSATRQLLTSTTEDGTIRPARPPTVVPAMYRPIAEPSDEACTSSARNAIATAGIPASATPCTARPTSRTPSVGLNGNSNPITLDVTPDVSITVMRP